jgi:hypothetical protein
VPSSTSRRETFLTFMPAPPVAPQDAMIAF